MLRTLKMISRSQQQCVTAALHRRKQALSPNKSYVREQHLCEDVEAMRKLAMWTVTTQTTSFATRLSPASSPIEVKRMIL